MTTVLSRMLLSKRATGGMGLSVVSMHACTCLLVDVKHMFILVDVKPSLTLHCKRH